MKVNLGVELDDAQRRALSCLLTGKATAKLATRDQVRDFLGGIVAALRAEPATSDDMSSPAPVPAAAAVSGARAPFTAAELEEAGRLAAEGRNPEYIRGWILTGRAIASQRRRVATLP